MSDFKKLRVWQKARDLTAKIYRETAHFPPSELYGLVSQMRRCCVSVGSNIAEGCGRASEADKARFFQMPLGSICELEFQMVISNDLGFIDQESSMTLAKDIEELGRMLGALTKTIRESNTLSMKKASSQ